MKFQIVIDNRSQENNLELHSEHGLSIYFETDGKKWLFDTGASGNFAVNAAKMGIHINEIDKLIISHGHNDHTGGLETFLSLNNKAEIFIAPDITTTDYISYKRKTIRNISTNKKLITENKKQFHFVKNNKILTKNVALMTKYTITHPQPRANKTLFVADELEMTYDNFAHEITLIVKERENLIILSACSHNGVLNIIQSACEFMKMKKIKAYIGGTHLIDNTYDEKEINEITETLKKEHPDAVLFTGHCTGDNAMHDLWRKLRPSHQIRFLYSGAILNIE